MSFNPTEKIHLSKQPVLPEATSEQNNYRTSLSSNINLNYSSPFKKISNNHYAHYSPNLQMVNSPLNQNSKTLFIYPPRQYVPIYDRNVNLYQKNYYYNNENTQNISSENNNINDMRNKTFERKDILKQDNNNNNEKINMNINMNVSNNVYHFCLGEKNNNINNNNIHIYSSDKYKEEKAKKKFSCRCKKSNCMKLYCDCFANGEKCIGCNCVNCSNVIGNEINIKKVYDEVVGKNPVSMKLNLQKKSKTNGCNCSKSNCLKKYCECYKAGLKCSKICRCKICENMENKEESSINISEDAKEVNILENKKAEIINDNIEKINDKENENKENNLVIKNNTIEFKKYDYEKFMFEKISILIKNDKMYIQKYNLLKDLDLKDELNNNQILFSNNANDVNNNNDIIYLQKKTKRPKENSEK